MSVFLYFLNKRKEVLDVMMEQLEKVSCGISCDEIAWLDVATHMAKQVNRQGDVVFIPQGNHVSEGIQ